jgi:hypothetical protein
MKTSVRFVICVVVFLLMTGRTSSQTSAKSRQQGDSAVFSEDDNRFNHSVRIPTPVIDALLATPEVKEIANGEPKFAREKSLSELNRNQISQLFSAVEVHLSDAKDADFVVLGHFPLSGADNSWFWVIRSPMSHPKIILFANGNGIEISKSKTNGYSNILSYWSSAAGCTLTWVYRYDGVRYRLAHKYTKNFGSEP